MKKITAFILTLIPLCLARPATAQTVDELVDKNTAAKGGEQKISAIESLVMKGNASMMGMEMPILLYQKRPDKLRREMTVQGMAVVVGYDGETAWMVNPMQGTSPVKMPADQAAQTKYQANLDGLLFNYKEKGFTLEYAGEENVRGRKSYKLKLTLPDDETMMVYLDAETYLETKLDVEVDNPQVGGKATVESFLSDYRDVQGLQVPFSYEVLMNGQVFQQITFDEITIDGEVPDSLFAFPAGK